MQSRGAVFLLRERAETIGERLSDRLDLSVVRSWTHESKPISTFHELFNNIDQWVMVMSLGIAVRFLDGLVRDKLSDPAVVVVDEGCHYAVSLLCGHEGGANRLAFAVANVLGATPVVSTATESLRPLVVGIGCRKNVTADAVEHAVRNALGSRSIDEIRLVATVDLKADEPGLLEFCRRHGLPLRLFSSEAIASRPWVTEPSPWVQESIGLPGVSEPCALMATTRGRLVVPKTCAAGVAVAVVEDSVN